MIAFSLDRAPAWGGRGALTNQSSGGHLASGHPINAVIDKDHGYIFAPISRVDGFPGADSGQISVSLISKDDILRPHPFYRAGHCQPPSVRAFYTVKIPIVISHYRATYGGNPDNRLPDIQLINHFRHQTMDNPMPASGAIVGFRSAQTAAGPKNLLFIHFPATLLPWRQSPPERVPLLRSGPKN